MKSSELQELRLMAADPELSVPRRQAAKAALLLIEGKIPGPGDDNSPEGSMGGTSEPRR
jgi:hypothetical protein